MASLTPTNPDALLDLQRTVQRKLGRCLLRLQQYEILLKSLVAHRDIAGPPARLQAIRDAQVVYVQKMTLGTLVGMLTDSYLTPNQDDAAASEDESGDGGLWAWASMASVMATPAYEDLFANGIWPDGSVNWPTSGAVSCLREAESRFATHGWTKLNTATAWIREQHSDQQPQRYGCGSWRQVIHESRQFEIRKQGNKDNGCNEVWYRSRPVETAIQQEQQS
ncbi:OST-HTH/LOTUS domain-containing protein [Cupriavidus sp. IK-TO18]|uniref:OST-HTH/LOTUS domain-containing protein n=1 Tax=Cupriavidus sp. IK-TO18 TaxID=2782182 RepID=UPI00189854B6|nr:OST-HTH/LOTUS domain-containing protein [Cupriavidus sp. IK-TO18]MBF6986486.1 OST-HTH/LOTUS domain-containing protein [Cupriavidus sp. IK-TO18]